MANSLAKVLELGEHENKFHLGMIPLIDKPMVRVVSLGSGLRARIPLFPFVETDIPGFYPARINTN